MKHFLTILIVLVIARFSFGQNSKEESFRKAIKGIVQNLTKRDSIGLSKCIDKNEGVYILYTIGIQEFYSNYSRLGFSDSTYPIAPFYDNVKITKLKYSSLPSFDCEKWTKTGMFVDTLKTDHFLSKIAIDLNEKSFQKTSRADLNKIKSLETKSRRIIIADNEGGELIFYLGFVHNKWVLTIIDKATCDCSV